MRTRPRTGFTLIELLLVLGIVSVIAAVLLIVLNPSELLKQARDSKRIADLTTLSKALALYQSTFSSGSMGSSSVLYVSIPDSSPTCANLGLPTAPSGYTYACKTSSAYRNIDGTGWIPLNFSALDAGNPFSSLPTDPTNASTSLLYYVYSTSGNAYAVSAATESAKYGAVAQSDGGSSATRIEKGTDLALAAAHGGSDADASAFFTAAGITDDTQKSAVNQLVLDLKAANIWTKMNAIYPFVGGTASTHSYNLKNPAQYQITWNGTVTHNANGMTGNGTTGYGDTGLQPSTVLGLNNVHVSVYSRTNSAASQVDIGSYSGNTSQIAIWAKYTDNKAYGEIWSTPNDEIGVTVPASTGMFLATRRGANDMELYRNGASLGTNVVARNGTLPSANIGIGRRIGSTEYSSRNIAFASIGSSLTTGEAASFYAAVQAFETTLGRNV